ncbi:MAG: tryptophan-rich sensory protein [Clostridia bacterium]|nr:tryptophan-rich sensory protein [Clostridia bacterium]
MKKQTALRIFWFLLPLVVGGLSALLTRQSMDLYDTVQKPSISPPAILFPIVWSILYLLMGISALLVYNRGCSSALLVFCVQLFLNFLWPLLFFNAQAFWTAFLLLLLLFVTVLWTVILFYRCRPLAGYLMIPYLLWIAFAGYLNVMIAVLN